MSLRRTRSKRKNLVYDERTIHRLAENRRMRRIRRGGRINVRKTADVQIRNRNRQRKLLRTPTTRKQPPMHRDQMRRLQEVDVNEGQIHRRRKQIHPRFRTKRSNSTSTANNKTIIKIHSKREVARDRSQTFFSLTKKLEVYISPNNIQKALKHLKLLEGDFPAGRSSTVLMLESR